MGPVFAESPFASHVGIEVRPSALGSGAVSADGDHLTNHVGSWHAGALFAAGDCAGAALVASTFPPQVADGLGVRVERIRYERMAKGLIRANARVVHDVEEADLVNEVTLSRIRSFEVAVDMTDEDGRSVATMDLEYYLESPTEPTPHLNGGGDQR